jgi:DNA processing protein
MKNYFDEVPALLILIRYADNAGAVRCLLEKYTSAKAALAASKSEWRSLGVSEKAYARMLAPDLARLDQDLQWHSNAEHHLIAWHSTDYPCLLRQADNPPAALFVAGDINLLWHPQIAIVGSRHPSAGGSENARQFARAFSEAGWCVSSGMAEGIDTSAHRAVLALSSEKVGRTLAVVATGLDMVYPEQNHGLMQSISQHGAIISEHPPGTPPLKQHFPSRNRIIAALSLGCLVVEAAERSGALITARQAAEIGREVFAIPGSIHNPMARGCHKLIRQGATLVEKPLEVIESLQPIAIELADALRGRLQEIEPAEYVPQKNRVQTLHRPIWEAIGHDFVNLDQLHERTGLTTPELSSMLLLMELEGIVTVADGRYTRNT